MIDNLIKDKNTLKYEEKEIIYDNNNDCDIDVDYNLKNLPDNYLKKTICEILKEEQKQVYN